MPIGVYTRKFKQFCKWGHERTPENLNKHLQCKLCAAARKRNSYHNNADKLRKRSRDWYVNNKDLVLSRSKQKTQKLTDEYVSKMFNGLDVVPVELIDLKRQHILLKREIKNAINQNCK